MFADDSDHDRAAHGDTWRIARVRETVEAGEEDLVAEIEGGGEIPLRAALSGREREILLAGGVRALIAGRAA